MKAKDKTGFRGSRRDQKIQLAGGKRTTTAFTYEVGSQVMTGRE